MIWKFDNSQVYILGSVHAMKEGAINHQSAINDVYDKVSKVVFETSLDFEQIPMCLYENHKLSENTSKTLFRDTKKAWLKHGLEYSELEKSKIWRAALSINSIIVSDNGFLEESGVDRIMWNKSKEDNKEIEWLESQVSGLSCFDNAPLEEQHKLLMKPVRDKKEVINEMVTLTDSWNSSDEEGLLRILNAALEEFPEMFNNLVLQRNSDWLSKFIAAINSDIPTLFVVGVLHCVGKYSIQNMLLESHGYTSKIIKPELQA
jgi:uncharacterized protein YbaP (TraB family)